MYLKKRNKLKILFKCKKLLHFFYNYDNFIFINFNYFNKLNYFNFLTFIQNNKFFYCNVSKLNSNQFNIINNIFFLKNTNYILSLAKEKEITKDFITLLNSYNNENVDFMYLKVKKFNTLISFSYLTEFFKNNSNKSLNVKLLKIIYFPILHLMRINKNITNTIGNCHNNK